MDVFIWRESVYKNNFRCNKCGRILFDTVRHRPTDNCCVDASKINDVEHDLWCVCKNLVGKQRVMDDKHFSEQDKLDVLNGNINEWLENKERDVKSKAREMAEELSKKQLRKEVQRLVDKVNESENLAKRLKVEYEKSLAKKDKQIQELTKEITSLEAQMRKMEKQMLGGKE